MKLPVQTGRKRITLNPESRGSGDRYQTVLRTEVPAITEAGLMTAVAASAASENLSLLICGFRRKCRLHPQLHAAAAFAAQIQKSIENPHSIFERANQLENTSKSRVFQSEMATFPAFQKTVNHSVKIFLPGIWKK